MNVLFETDVGGSSMSEQKSIVELLLDFTEQHNAYFTYKQAVEQLAMHNSIHDCKIFQMLDEVVLKDESNGFHRTLEPGTEVFRARSIGPGDYIESNGFSVDIEKRQTRGFNRSNSIECPLNLNPSGRNNIKGASYLYAAEDEATACAETRSVLTGLVSIATFRVIKQMHIIDFTRNVKIDQGISEKHGMNITLFMTLVMQNYFKPAMREEEYIVTQYISDYIRKAKVDGISYRSQYTDKCNYTIFNSHSMFIEFVESRILYHHGCENSYWDFNNNSSIKAEKTYGNPTETEANDLLQKLRNSLRVHS